MFNGREDLKIKDIATLFSKTFAQPPNSTQPRNTRAHRYLVFEPCGKYELIRPGSHTFSFRAEIEESQLKESMLFHFRHKDDWVSRHNKFEYRYVSVFKVDTEFIIPHQNHLKQIYKNCGRVNSKMAESLMDDKTPYWTDVYMNRLLKENSDKKKYRKRKRDVD